LHILSGDLWGGAEVQICLQAAAQRAEGVDARALLFNSGETSSRFSANSIPIFIAPEATGFFGLVKTSLGTLKALRPDVIVSHGYKETILGSILSILSGTPLVSTFHGWSESYRGLRKLKMFIYSSLYLFCSRVIAKRRVTVTQALADQLRLDADVIHNVAGETSEPKSGVLEAERASIVAVGRLVNVKRLDRAIESMKLLSNHSSRPVLYLVGDGPLRSTLEALVERLQLKDSVRFLGFRDDASGLISSADILLLTSESEGLPTVILEAMKAGVSVVATRLAGIQELAALFPGYPLMTVEEPSPEEFFRAASGFLDRPQSVDASLLTLVRDYLAPKRAAVQAIEGPYQGPVAKHSHQSLPKSRPGLR
jgi:glycosyltransferase involved in cell wall biosynthesis